MAIEIPFNCFPWNGEGKLVILKDDLSKFIDSERVLPQEIPDYQKGLVGQNITCWGNLSWIKRVPVIECYAEEIKEGYLQNICGENSWVDDKQRLEDILKLIYLFFFFLTGSSPTGLGESGFEQ